MWPKQVYIVLNLISIYGPSGLMVKYAIHFQNEVKLCMRSLVQSLLKPGVFLKFYFSFTSLGSITSSFTGSIGPVLKLK